MSNVVPLSSDKVLPGEVNSELVAMLETVLEEARSGRICAAAFVTVRPDRQAATAWKGDGSQNALASGILTLLHRYGAALAT